MFKSGSVVAVAGSRSLPPGGADAVRAVVAELLRSGCRIAVGCCKGADEAALSACVPSLPVSVFAAFGPGGEGAGPASAVGPVLSWAKRGGAVSWWVGGGPAVPLRARLAARTRAVVSAATGGLVVFLASPDSRGSMLACRFAVARGLPVVAFPLGFSSSALPVVGAGRWIPEGGSGPWAGAWRWAPEPDLFQAFG